MPDTEEHSGAIYLSFVRNELVARLTTDPAQLFNDALPGEIAALARTGFVPTKWAEFTDLEAWQEDPSTLDNDASDMNHLADVCLYIIGSRLAERLLAGAREAVFQPFEDEFEVSTA